MKISKRVRAIVGLVSIVLIVAAAILWNTVLRQQITSVQIVTLAKPVQRGERIEASNLVMRSISRSDLVSGAVQSQADAQRLTQYEARQYIPAGIQLVKEFFDTPELVLTDSTYIFPVPSEWIIAVPATLRRKDTVVFYAVSPSLQSKAASSGSSVQPSATPSAAPTSTADVSGGSSTASAGAEATTPSAETSATATPAPTPTMSLEERIQIALEAGQKYEIKTVVAYVKDKSNHEIITSSASAAGKIERLDGSGNIDHIEIIATKEQMDALQTAYLQGYRFVVLYQ